MLEENPLSAARYCLFEITQAVVTGLLDGAGLDKTGKETWVRFLFHCCVIEVFALLGGLCSVG
jgi:hypothetical protein